MGGIVRVAIGTEGNCPGVIVLETIDTGGNYPGVYLWEVIGMWGNCLGVLSGGSCPGGNGPRAVKYIFKDLFIRRMKMTIDVSFDHKLSITIHTH